MEVETKDIIEEIRQAKAKKQKVYPQYVVRASEVGHPCERYLVYCITHWAERNHSSPDMEFIFEGGRAVEELAVQDFLDAGYKVYRPEPDKAIQESRPRLSGHLDIRVDFGDSTVFTGEIKGLNLYDWEKLNTIEDFFRSKKVWIRKYPAQLMTYLYIKAEPRGFFYLKSIPRFFPKIIWVDLDYGYMEQILQKTERVEAHVAGHTLPAPMPYDDAICDKCAFAHICLPDRIGKEVEVTDNTELLELVTRYETLKPGAKEYDDVNERINKLVEGREKILVGDYFIEGKWQARMGYDIPLEIKAQYQKPGQFWRKNIIPVGGANGTAR
ncbi:MAG: hypothetical protein MUP81_06120 [Dehalococcoidia bacterium]|nr:hypothetical protein [Dehalococcoidia bacterium]